MNNLVAASVIVPFLMFVFCVAISALLAQKRDAQLDQRLPDSLSYKWGFFLGYYGIIAGVLVGVTAAIMIWAGFYPGLFLLVLAHAVIFGIASYGVLHRRKWGWVLHIPLSLNPGLWAFNSVYVNNRWREFV